MNLKGVMKSMRESFVGAKQRIDERNLPIPEGDYLARINQCIVKKSKSSENHYIGLAYQITDGEEKGRTVWDNSLLLIPEKADFVIGFFDKFGFDTDEIINDESGETIISNCEFINQKVPMVRIRTKHWSPPENEDDVRVNVYLNKVIDDIFENDESQVNDQDQDQSVDNDDDQSEVGVDTSFLDNMNKKELKDFIIYDETYGFDINIKTIIKTHENELREMIREQIVNSSDDNDSTEETTEEDTETEALRQRLLQLCESQISDDDFNDSMTLDQLKEVCEEYTFFTEGDSALTNEEIEILIDCGLDNRINDSTGDQEEEQEVQTNAPPPKQKQKSTPKQKQNPKTKQKSAPKPKSKQKSRKR